MIVVLVYLLTALVALDVALTRRRLAGGGVSDRASTRPAGRAVVGVGPVRVHAGVGAAAVVLWLVYLVLPEDSPPGDPLVGIVALLLLWITALAGLMILARRLPGRGRGAGEGRGSGWTDGPWLSVVAHVGLLLGVAFFTWAYATSAV